MSKRFVYGLIDPVTREMRYVGATTVGMKRPRGHLRPSIYDGPGRHRELHLYCWIRSVVASGGLPEIVVIEYAADDESPFNLEMGWVSYFRGIGCRLTNETDGGKGRIGYKASEEAKRKLRERIHTQEWRDNMSKAQKKRFEHGMPKEHKDKISKSLNNISSEERRERSEKFSKSQLARRQRERDSRKGRS